MYVSHVDSSTHIHWVYVSKRTLHEFTFHNLLVVSSTSVMFHIVYCRLCLQHRLDNTVPCGQSFCFYNTNGFDFNYSHQPEETLVTESERVEQKKRFVQIFEVITTVQVYLIHKTLFDSITGASLLDNCNPITSLPIPFFSMFVLCSSSYCHIFERYLIPVTVI